MSKTHCFISYSSKDKNFAEKLATSLNQNGLPTFFDRWEIKVGDSIVEKIDSALGKITHLIIILSKSSVKSKWVKKELSSALMKKLDDNSIEILPVLKEPCTIPTIINDLKYADFSDTYENGFLDLIESLDIKPVVIPKIDINLPKLLPIISVQAFPVTRYKPKYRSEFKTKSNLQTLANALIDIAGAYTGKEVLYCGKCSAPIYIDKGEQRPLVCKRCGDAINWVGIKTRLIKECPVCSKEFSMQDNFCSFHFPSVQLITKEIELLSN